MGEHLVLYVDRLVNPTNLQEIDSSVASESSSRLKEKREVDEEALNHSEGEEEPLINGAECRICQEEDHITSLEVPCGCSGSLKYAHRKCVQRWCNEKGDITCEICHQLTPMEAWKGTEAVYFRSLKARWRWLWYFRACAKHRIAN